MKVYEAINKVQRELAASGISKDRRNQSQGYSFRGIDDIYNVVSPLLGKHGLCIIPRALKRECVERVNSKGTALFYVTVEAEFDFVAAEDGSHHTARAFGEAMDSGDKATNKAMSAAYKYAVMQAFAIPTEGDNDADAHTHDVAPRKMPDDELRRHLAAIEGATIAKEFKQAVAAATDAAEAIGDTEALEVIRAAAAKKAEKARAA